MNKFVSVLLILVMTVLAWWFVPGGHGQTPSAIALIQQEQEGPEQFLFKTRHRLQDSQGRIWQGILYKRIKAGQSLGVNLRLVGFLGAVAIDHPANLEVLTHNGELLVASDQFADGSPSPNVGEYSFNGVLAKLTDYQAFTLTLPITSDRGTTINIPSALSLEWQALNAKDQPQE